jgi:tRNA(fMet)-specific endonuclease VapC
MGVILDSSVLIAGERSLESVQQVLDRIGDAVGDPECAVSSITVVELTHGIYRARNTADRKRRETFCDALFSDLEVYPVSLPIAQLAGQIEGEQASQGNLIATADLLIGATAVFLGFDLVTLNLRHFQRIPGLRVTQL